LLEKQARQLSLARTAMIDEQGRLEPRTPCRMHAELEGWACLTLIHTSGKGFLGQASTPPGILVPPTTQSCAGAAPPVASPAVQATSKAAGIAELRRQHRCDSFLIFDLFLD
jgi:hypothetical protein